MRLTGLISLRGAGRFIDINHNEDKRVEYVLSHYSHYQKYQTERAYFDYMARIDENLFAVAPVVADATRSEELLQNWVTTYDWSNIKSELNILATRNKVSKDEVLPPLQQTIILYSPTNCLKSFFAELIFLPRMHELGTKFIRKKLVYSWQEKKLTSWQENQDNL
jgi:hypothetical protein